MKKAKYLYLLLLFLPLIAGSCTQNNGRIGNLFGSWVLESLTVDGAPEDLSGPDYTSLAFQSNIACFTYYDGDFSTTRVYCTWVKTDNIITFDFRNHSDKTP